LIADGAAFFFAGAFFTDDFLIGLAAALGLAALVVFLRVAGFFAIVASVREMLGVGRWQLDRGWAPEFTSNFQPLTFSFHAQLPQRVYYTTARERKSRSVHSA
jgi:hypothetical protein